MLTLYILIATIHYDPIHPEYLSMIHSTCILINMHIQLFISCIFNDMHIDIHLHSYEYSSI